MTGRWWRVAVACAFLGSAAVADPKVATPEPIKSTEVLTAREGIGPGQRLDLAIRVTLHEAFHVNSHTPSQKFLIPTTLDVETVPELEFETWVYPKGESRTFAFAQTPLWVYEGEFLIRGKVKVAEGTAPGKRRTVARLRYQACTRDKCYAPRQREIPIELTIVPSGVSTPVLHPRIFDPHP